MIIAEQAIQLCFFCFFLLVLDCEAIDFQVSFLLIVRTRSFGPCPATLFVVTCCCYLLLYYNVRFQIVTTNRPVSPVVAHFALLFTSLYSHPFTVSTFYFPRPLHPLPAALLRPDSIIINLSCIFFHSTHFAFPAHSTFATALLNRRRTESRTRA
jgi:hypothetical protein